MVQMYLKQNSLATHIKKKKNNVKFKIYFKFHSMFYDFR